MASYFYRSSVVLVEGSPLFSMQNLSLTISIFPSAHGSRTPVNVHFLGQLIMVHEDLGATRDMGSYVIPIVVVILARDSRRSGFSQTHNCQARLQLQGCCAILSVAAPKPPQYRLGDYRTTPVTVTYARMRIPNPCLMRHQSIHFGPHGFGLSNSCPLLTDQTASAAELKRYILENHH